MLADYLINQSDYIPSPSSEKAKATTDFNPVSSKGQSVQAPDLAEISYRLFIPTKINNFRRHII